MNQVEIKGAVMLSVRIKHKEEDGSIDYATIEINGEDISTFLAAYLSEGIGPDADGEPYTTLEGAAAITISIVPAAPLDIAVLKRDIPPE